MTTRQDIEDFVLLHETAILLADGYEDAFLGLTYQASFEVDEQGDQVPRAVYSQEVCLQILVERDGMSLEEAYEYFEFNTLRSLPHYPNSPLFVMSLGLNMETKGEDDGEADSSGSAGTGSDSDNGGGDQSPLGRGVSGDDSPGE